MTHTEKEKTRKLLQVFDDLIRDNEYFDILYSEKMGYVQIYSEEKYGEAIYAVLKDFESVARALFNEVIDTVRDLQMCGEHDNVDLYPAEEEEADRRIMQYIVHMGSDADCCKQIWQTMLDELRKLQ